MPDTELVSIFFMMFSVESAAVLRPASLSECFSVSRTNQSVRRQATGGRQVGRKKGACTVTATPRHLKEIYVKSWGTRVLYLLTQFSSTFASLLLCGFSVSVITCWHGDDGMCVSSSAFPTWLVLIFFYTTGQSLRTSFALHFSFKGQLSFVLEEVFPLLHYNSQIL